MERGEGKRCHGFISDDGKWAHCAREEYAGDAPYNVKTEAYVHKLTGDCKCGESHDGGGTVVDFPAREDKNGPRPKIVNTYDYTDERGDSLFEVVRFEPKDFRQRRRNERGGWTWKVRGTRRVPYRLPELLAADPTETVYIFEGEEDVNRAYEEGLVATTNPEGAGCWREEFSSYVEDRDVVIVPDNDPEGHKHAEEVARSTYPRAASVRVLRLPDLGHKEDFRDWLDKHGASTAELIAIAKGTPPWSPPSTNGSVTALATASITAPPSKPRNTDMGNSERFISQHGENLRYCWSWARWLVWTGSRWAIDDSGMVHRLAKETVKSIYAEAGQAETEEERKSLSAHARRSESANAIKAMLELARSDVPVSPDELDARPYLLNAPNGTVDLQAGEIREHRREDYLTKITGADYRPDTPAPIFEAFLERVQPSESVRAFIQRAAGYSATGDTSEQCMFINHGPGANGKSTYDEIIAAALGDYATRTPTDMLMARRFTGVPNDVARLKGARFVAAAETEEGRRLDEARIKDLTGQDTVTARFMRGEWFDFTPTHKLHLSTNHKPEIRGTDNAIWRRIRLIPWSVTVPPAEQDKKLPEKLRAELGGILSWVVAGCLEWHREGLKPPDEVRKATGEYRAEMDVLAAFIRSECVTGEGMRAIAGTLYERYREWCTDTGEKAENQRRFSERLRERGYDRERITSGPNKGKHEYHGIALLQEGGPVEPMHSIGEAPGADSTPPQRSKGAQSGTSTLHSGEAGEATVKDGFTPQNTSKSPINEADTTGSIEAGDRKNDISSSEKPREGLIPENPSPASPASPEEDEEPDPDYLALLEDLYPEEGEE